MFKLPKYIEPDFSQSQFTEAPDVRLLPSPVDNAAPRGFHATSIYPEYFKVDGKWLLAEDSRMDCVPVYENGKIYVREFRNIKKGDLIAVGRSEDASEGIYVHADCFEREEENKAATFSFRQSRSRETGFSCDYRQLYELLRHEKENGGYIVWVMGPACSFDAEAR